MDVLTRSLSESVLANSRARQHHEAIFRFIEGVSALLASVSDDTMTPSLVAHHQSLIVQATKISHGLPVPCAALWAVHESSDRQYTARQMALLMQVGKVLTTHSFDHASLSRHFTSLNAHLKAVIAEGGVPLDIYDRASSALKVVSHYMR